MITGGVMVGSSKRIITPPLEVPYLSFAPRLTPFVAIHDDLYARAVAVGSPAGRAAIVISVDALGVGSTMLGSQSNFIEVVRQKISERSSPRVPAVMITATHAHSTPETSGMHPICGTGVVDAWLESLVDQVVNVAIDALESMQPAVASLGTISLPSLVTNRRQHLSLSDPYVDSTLSVVQFTTVEDSRILLFHFACHPVIVQAQPWISSDFPGHTAELIEHATPSPPKRAAIFVQGACGDVNPACGATGSFDDVERYGRTLAAAIDRMTAATEAQMEPALSDVVDSAATSIMLPPRARPLCTDLEDASGVVGDPMRRGTPEWSRAEDLLLMDRAVVKRELAAEIQVLRIGDLAIVGIPGEPFGEIGASIRSASPAKQTLIAGYANGYLGYFATRCAWQEGGYEVGMGPWALASSDAADMIIRTATDLLNKLWP